MVFPMNWVQVKSKLSRIELRTQEAKMYTNQVSKHQHNNKEQSWRTETANFWTYCKPAVNQNVQCAVGERLDKQINGTE